MVNGPDYDDTSNKLSHLRRMLRSMATRELPDLEEYRHIKHLIREYEARLKRAMK